MAIDHIRVRLRRVLSKVNVKAPPLFLWWCKCRECGPVEVFGRPRVGPGAGNLRVSMSVFPSIAMSQRRKIDSKRKGLTQKWKRGAVCMLNSRLRGL
jgi:hypothetical protein